MKNTLKNKYDLAVAWRIYPKISKTPLIFPDDKFKLACISLKSFKLSTEKLKIKYFFILDGCPEIYSAYIENVFNSDDYEIINQASIGNLPTFKLQIDILCKQQDSDIVYFAEDDYLYCPGEFSKIVSLIRNNTSIDFASCYFHTDSFNHPIHRHKKDNFDYANHHWIIDSSTCLTFITKKETLLRTRKILETYSKGNNDCAMWLVLTKTFIYNPLKYLEFFFTHKESFNILKVAVKYSFKYFFTFKKYKLAIASPAIGTHLEKEFVSPGINWIKLSEDIINGIYDN